MWDKGTAVCVSARVDWGPQSEGRPYTNTDVMTSWDVLSMYRSCHRINTCFGNLIN